MSPKESKQLSLLLKDNYKQKWGNRKYFNHICCFTDTEPWSGDVGSCPSYIWMDEKQHTSGKYRYWQCL